MPTNKKEVKDQKQVCCYQKLIVAKPGNEHHQVIVLRTNKYFKSMKDMVIEIGALVDKNIFGDQNKNEQCSPKKKKSYKRPGSQ